MATFIYGNLSSKTASPSLDPSPLTFPTVVQGDDFSLTVRLVETLDGITTVTAPVISYARLSYGPVDVAPTAGTFKMVVGGVTSGVVTYGSSAASVAAVLNAMATPATAWSVTLDRDSYLVSRTDAWTATSGITITENKLEPESFVRVTSYSAAGQFIQELRPMQSPLAYTSAFALIVPPAPSFTRVVTGYRDDAAGVEVNEVQRLYVPPTFDRAYQIYRGTRRTRQLSRDDGAAEIQSALATGVQDSAAGEQFLVTNPITNYADVEFAGSLAGVAQDLLTVQVPISTQGDLTFDLNLNTQGMLAALRDNFEVTHPLTCEVAINYGTVTTPNIKYVTVFQQNMTVQADGAWTGLAAAQRINWLNPPQPVNYIPFTTDQVITGIQSYTAVVTGAGPWTVAHNLGTEAIHVTVRENISNGYLLGNENDYTVQTATSQSITVTKVTGTVPTAGWAVMISSAGPTSAFLAHTHTIAQVVSLQDFLNGLDTRLDTLEGVLPSAGPVGVSTVTQPFSIPVPTKGEVMFAGSSHAFSVDGGIASVPSLLPTPYMLKALSVTAATAASSALISATTVDIVSTYTSGLDLKIPRIGIIPGATLGTGLAYVGAEAGRALVYQVHPYGSARTYYPTAFERPLFEVAVNDRMFRANQKLSIAFDVVVQSRDATALPQWWVMVDVGEVTTASTPVTQSENVTGITWKSTPLLAQPLLITGQPQRHSFGVEILSTATSGGVTMNANQIHYGVASSASAGAPTGRNFILRGRLTNFDVADNLSDPRGWLGYALAGPLVSGSTQDLEVTIR